MKKILPIFFILFFVSGCAQRNPITRTELIFDTPVTISISLANGENVLSEAFNLCRKYEQRFSKNIPTSEVYELNNSNGEPVIVSDELLYLLEQSIYYSSITDGLFDITINPLFELWDFKSDNPVVPLLYDINTALKSIGYKNIYIHGNEVTLKNNAKIDLGGIAKGYIADELNSFLISKGVESATIDLGGNIVTIGSKSTDDDWKVGICNPSSDTNDIILSIDVNSQSIVTAGAYERNFTIDEKIYHHILNPKTGFPAESDLISVTIITPSSFVADGLSTSCFLLGLDKSMQLIENSPDVEAIFIDKENEIHTTSGIGTTIPINYLK